VEEICPYGRRALAFIIDLLYELIVPIPVVTVALFMLFFDSTRGLAIFLLILSALWLGLAGIFNRVILQGRRGSSWGKNHLKIKLVKAATREPIGFFLALLRWILALVLGSVTGGLLLIIDLIAPAFSSQNQRILDRLLGTIVVHDRGLASAQPSDSSSMTDDDIWTR